MKNHKIQWILGGIALLVLPLVLQYTAVHGLIFVMFGWVTAGLLALADREPRVLFAVAMLYVCFEVFFIALVGVLAERLFDVLTLWMYPVVLGQGKKVFPDGATPANVTLLEPALTGPRGVVQLRYGPADVITDGVDGFLVPYGDRKAMAERIAALLPDRELLARASARAIARAADFSEDAFAARWAALFNELASPPQASSTP